MQPARAQEESAEDESSPPSCIVQRACRARRLARRLRIVGRREDADAVLRSHRADPRARPQAVRGRVRTYTVKARYGDSPSLAATLVEEGKNSPADLFFSQDAGSLDAVEKQGLLLKLPADILAKVAPSAFSRRPARWVGITGRSRIIAYGEKVKASELPDSPLELTDEKWKGRVGWAPTNASMQGYITALRLVEGEDVAKKWLEGMVANDVQVYDSNIPVRDAIAKGEIDLGLINHYYVAEAQAEDPDYPVKVHFPPKDLGSLVNVAGVGVLASTENKAQALKFVRQMLSTRDAAATSPTARRSTRSSRACQAPKELVAASEDPVAEDRPRQARRPAGHAEAHAGDRGACRGERADGRRRGGTRARAPTAVGGARVRRAPAAARPARPRPGRSGWRPRCRRCTSSSRCSTTPPRRSTRC